MIQININNIKKVEKEVKEYLKMEGITAQPWQIFRNKNNQIHTIITFKAIEHYKHEYLPQYEHKINIEISKDKFDDNDIYCKTYIYGYGYKYKNERYTHDSGIFIKNDTAKEMREQLSYFLTINILTMLVYRWNSNPKTLIKATR